MARDTCDVSLTRATGSVTPTNSFWASWNRLPKSDCFHQGAQDPVLRLVDGVHGRRGHSCLRADRGNRDLVDPFPDKQPLRGGKDTAARVLRGLRPGVQGCSGVFAVDFFIIVYYI